MSVVMTVAVSVKFFRDDQQEMEEIALDVGRYERCSLVSVTKYVGGDCFEQNFETHQYNIIASFLDGIVLGLTLRANFTPGGKLSRSQSIH